MVATERQFVELAYIAEDGKSVNKRPAPESRLFSRPGVVDPVVIRKRYGTYAAQEIATWISLITVKYGTWAFITNGLFDLGLPLDSKDLAILKSSMHNSTHLTTRLVDFERSGPFVLALTSFSVDTVSRANARYTTTESVFQRRDQLSYYNVVRDAIALESNPHINFSSNQYTKSLNILDYPEIDI